MADLGTEIARYLEESAIFVGDAYYACKQMINPLLEQGHDLVTRVLGNAVAYYKAPIPKVRRRGRPKLYGKKVKLKKLFENVSEFIAAPSPVYGKTMVEISILKPRSVVAALGTPGQIRPGRTPQPGTDHTYDHGHDHGPFGGHRPLWIPF